MNPEEIKTYLGPDWEAMTFAVRRSLASDISLLDKTNRALLEDGGKQLRPMVVLLGARLCGGVTQDSIRFAAAMELLHNATLLHDDVADEADFRRGRPTVRALLGPTASVLLGDFWLVKALDNLLASEMLGPQAVRITARALRALAEGEMLQLQQAERCDTGESEYFRIIDCKTAVFFETAAALAALSAGASARASQALCAYALSLGRAFQVRDDILDYTGDGSLGKPVGVDLREHKITLPLLGALAGVDEAENRRIRERVRNFSGDSGEEKVLREFVLSGGIAYAQQRLEKDVDEALRQLDAFPPSEDREALAQLAHYIGRRTV